MKSHRLSKNMMARKKTTGRKKSQSGGAGPEAGISEDQHDEAMKILRAEYYQGVRSVAQDLARAIKDGEIKNQDDMETWVHQTVDGSYWVIYTHANFQVLMCSDNHDAYVEDVGEPPVEHGSINWAALAYAAMERDVRQQIDAEGIEPDWSELEEPRRNPLSRRSRR